MSSYLVRIAAWISQGFNCIVLFGSQDQTVSARCYVNRDDTVWGFMYRFINGVYFWQEDHCYESHLSDLVFADEIKGIK